MPPTTRTATATRRRLRRRPSAPSTAASCCRGLLAAALVARVATGAPSPLPVDGVEQQPSSQTTKQPPGGGGGGGGGLGLGLRSQDAAAPYSFDTRARTLGILQTLRSGQHPLEVLDEALPGGQGEVGFSLEMRGWDGRPYVCTPVMDPRPSLNATMDELPPLPPPPTPAAQQQPPNARLKALDNTCALLGGSAANGDEYWSYEWCHRKEIRQVHYGMPAQPEGQPVRDPDWSLGSYVRTEIRYADEAEGGDGDAKGKGKKKGGGKKKKKRKSKFHPEDDDEEAEEDAEEEAAAAATGRRIDHIVDRFEWGQPCDETGEGRRAAVRFFCCANPDVLPRDVQEIVKAMKPVPFAVAQLAAIREMSVCNYTLTVCTPLLCDATTAAAAASDPNDAAAAVAPAGVAPLTGAAAKSPVLRLLEPLAHFCLTRHEGYWSYEFCYKRGIRQFHNVAVRDPKGRVTSKVESEYVIGREHPSYGEDFKEEDYIVQGEGDADATHFAMEYPGGTECDLTRQQRSTTVHFVCGEGGTDQLVSVKEDRSCHYKVVVATPRLCQHPAFRTELPSARTVRCTPLGGGGGQGEGQGQGQQKKAGKRWW